MINWKEYWISSASVLVVMLLLSTVVTVAYPFWTTALISAVLWAVLQPVVILVIWMVTP